MRQQGYKSLHSVVSSHILHSKKRQTLCSCSPKWRSLKQKSLIVLLVWSFAAFIVGNYVVRRFVLPQDVPYDKLRFLLITFCAIIAFLASWVIANTFISRYKAIKVSLCIMLLGTMLYSLYLSLRSVVSLDYRTVNAVDLVMGIIMCTGFIGFQANIVQFAMDQLRDSSADEISFFINLYMWTFFASEVLIQIMHYCVCQNYEAYTFLLIPILVTIALCSDFFFGHLLFKDNAVSLNPMKLIFKVLLYAARNKYPQDRSTHDLWDRKRNSRLDLAKRLYGGPFSAEQVQDVKKFFRIYLLVAIGCLMLGMLLHTSVVHHISIPYHFREAVHLPSRQFLMNCSNASLLWTQCKLEFAVDVGSLVVAILVVPLWELVLFPLFWKSVMRCKMLQRHVLGMVVVVLFIVSLLAIQGYGSYTHNPSSDRVCPILHKGTDEKSCFDLPVAWLSVPSILINIGLNLLFVAGLQFVFAQSPSSMKGLVINTIYITLGVTVSLFYALQIPFHLKIFKSLGGLDCVFWFELTCGLVGIVLIVVFLLACSSYNRRQRDLENSSNAFSPRQVMPQSLPSFR